MEWDRKLEEHFKHVYDEVFSIVVKVVYRVTNDSEIAEELAHDAFIKLYERIDQFPDTDQAKYWLIRVAKNHALNYLKRKQRERRAYERVLAQPEVRMPSGEDQAIRTESEVEVRDALRKLPEKLRTILILKEYADLNYRDIASSLGISEANVKVRVFRARQKLAQILHDGQGEKERDMREDQILSEYIDGALPDDLAHLVQGRLQADPNFRELYEELLEVHERLKADSANDAFGFLSSENLDLLQLRVWQRLQLNLPRKQAKRNHSTPTWVTSIGHTVSSRIALPVPALAAMLIIFIGLTIVSFVRGSSNSTQVAVASDSGSFATTAPNIVSSAVPAGLQFSNAATNNVIELGLPGDVNVTIDSQNMRKLLTLLGGDSAVDEITIKLPQHVQSMQPAGEPVLLRESDVGLSKNNIVRKR